MTLQWVVTISGAVSLCVSLFELKKKRGVYDRVADVKSSVKTFSRFPCCSKHIDIEIILTDKIKELMFKSKFKFLFRYLIGWQQMMNL